MGSGSLPQIEIHQADDAEVGRGFGKPHARMELEPPFVFQPDQARADLADVLVRVPVIAGAVSRVAVIGQMKKNCNIFSSRLFKPASKY